MEFDGMVKQATSDVLRMFSTSLCSMKSFLHQLNIAPPTEEEIWRTKATKNTDEDIDSDSDEEMKLARDI
jgi:hypothetical protein